MDEGKGGEMEGRTQGRGRDWGAIEGEGGEMEERTQERAEKGEKAKGRVERWRDGRKEGWRDGGSYSGKGGWRGRLAVEGENGSTGGWWDLRREGRANGGKDRQRDRLG